MKVNIKATNLSLTLALEKAIIEKIAALDKFIPFVDSSVEAHVEVALTSRHHHKGPIYRAEANVRVPKELIRAEAEEENLLAAVNVVKDELQRELKQYKERHQALDRRRGRRIKRFGGKRGRIRQEGN